MSHGETDQPAEWRIAVKGEQRGPFTLDQVRTMLAEGRLPAETLVWRPGMGNWAAIGSVSELAMPAGRGPAPGAAAGPLGPATSPGPAAQLAAPSGGAGPNELAEFLAFRRMFTPVLVQILFWIGIAGCVFTALGQLIAGFRGGGAIGGVVLALLTLIVGPIVVRVYCELIIILFRIYDTLQEIKGQRK